MLECEEPFVPRWSRDDMSLPQDSSMNIFGRDDVAVQTGSSLNRDGMDPLLIGSLLLSNCFLVFLPVL